MFFYGYISKDISYRSEVVFGNVISDIKSEGFNTFGEPQDFAEEKLKLQDIRVMADLNALYTLGRSQNGTPEYIVTAFRDSVRESYRIYTETEDSLAKYADDALNGSRLENLKITDIDGNAAFLCIYPVTDGDTDNVIGAVGMEFDASNIKNYIANIGSLYMPLILIAVIMLIFVCTAIFNKTVDKIITSIAHTDSLTMLGNRIAYENHLDKINKKINDNIGKDFKIFVAVYDLDDLKIVNDAFGHLAGDEYISESASIISGCFEKIGKTYRIGGDEFAVVAEGCTEEQIKECLERYDEKEREFNESNSAYNISISYGYSGFLNGTDLNMDNVVKRADDKMYRKKREKKNKTQRMPR